MKLLDPRTIQQNLNAERKVDIDNGIKLARQVDSLREQYLNEEQKLSTFREVTVKQVQSEIDAKIKERDVLVSEITELNKERTELLKPLDEEWSLVIEERKKLEEEKTEIYLLGQKTQKVLNEANAKLEEIKKEEQRIADKSVVTQEELEKAHGMALEASKLLSDAREDEKRIKYQLKQKEAKLSEKEAILQATVNDIEIRERALKDDEQFINEEKIRLADMRSTLERALARIK